MYFFFYDTPEFKWISFSYQIKTYLEIATLFFTIGFVVAVAFSTIIGWPLYWLAKKYSLINYITSARAGIMVTIAPLILCIIFGWNIPSLTTRAGGLILFVLAFCGTISGLVFNMLEAHKKYPAHSVE
jgi:EamA domain-containing membrane protein RarD